MNERIINGSSIAQEERSSDTKDAPFDAFISYSHQYDSRTAPILQRAIESALDRFFGSRSLRVFRDEENLPMSEDLWGSIVSSLDRSSYFLLMASPGSRASEWVEREVAHFLKREGGREHIGIVLTAGKTPWTDPDYVAEAADNAIGSRVIDLLTRGAREPRVVDLRAFRKPNGGLTQSREFRERVAEIVARIKGVDKDVILRAHLKERRRRVAIFSLTVFAALLMAAMAYMEFDRRREQTALKLRSDAYESLYRKPLRAADFAYRASNIKTTPETESALQDAHRVAIKKMHTAAAENIFLSGKESFGWSRRRISSFVSRSSRDGRHELRALSTPGRSSKSSDVYLVDHESGYMRPLTWNQKEPKGEISAFGFLSAQPELFIFKGYTLLTFDLEGNPLKRVEYANLLRDKEPVHLLADVHGGDLVIAATTSGAVSLIDPEHQDRREIEPRDSIRGPLSRLVTSESGQCVLLVFEDETARALYISGFSKFKAFDLDVNPVISGVFHDDENSCQLFVTGRDGFTSENEISMDGISEIQRYSHDGEDVREIVYLPDQSHIVTLTDHTTLRFWQQGQATPLAVFSDSSGIDWKTWVNRHQEGVTLKRIDGPRSGKYQTLFVDELVVSEKIELAGREFLVYRNWGDMLSVLEVVDMKVKPFVTGSRMGGFNQVMEFGGDIWLTEHSSIYRVRRHETSKAHHKDWGTTMGMTTKVLLFPAQEKLWLGTTSGAYRIKGDQLIRLTDKSKIIANIEEIDGAVWIVAHVKLPPYGPYDSVLLQMQGERARQIHRIKGEAGDLIAHQGKNYLASGSRIYQFDRHVIEPVPGSGYASELYTFNDHLWAVGDTAYHVGLEGAKAIPSKETRVKKILFAQGKIWLRTEKGPLYVGQPDGTDFKFFPDFDTNVIRLIQAGDDVWFSTDQGAFRYKDGELIRIPDKAINVADLVKLEDAVWVVTADHAYRITGEVVQKFAPTSSEYPLTSVLSVSGRIAGIAEKKPNGSWLIVRGPLVEMLPSE